jgi:hypothetical protein
MRARFIRREHLPFQARLETVDEDTRRPEAGQLDHRHGSKLNQRPERHPLEVQAGCGDILAQVTRCDLEARFREGFKELERDQVDLSEIGYAGPAAGQITVSDKWTCVCVAFDAMAFQQHDPIPSGLAEAVTAIGGDRDHSALQ